MKEPKDKRTKEYKQWKQTYGLGDLVEDAANVLGIKKCAPCEERKRLLNKIPLFRKTRAVRCLTEDQLTEHSQYLEQHVDGKWEVNEVTYLIALYAHIFAIQYAVKTFCTNCAGSARILRDMQEKIDSVYIEELNK